MATKKESEPRIHVGVDVGKFKLDIFIHERGIHWQEDNSPQGIKSALNRIARYQVCRVVVEATGRYELALVDEAFERGLPAAVVAIQCNSVLKPFYQTLVAKGKHKKVAIVACMRKLITMLNAMIRDNIAWAY